MATVNLDPMLQPGSTKNVGICPVCGTFLLREPHTNYCRWCGCKLEWAKEDVDVDKVIIIMIGAPCSGKSTIGKAVASDIGIDYFSSGDIARMMGTEINQRLNAGEMAPEDRMREKISEIILSSSSFVLDGFPRFIDQLAFIEQCINISGHSLMFVIIDCSINDLAHRNMLRKRSDANSFANRIKFYICNTIPMIDDIQYKYQGSIIKPHSSIEIACVDIHSKYLDILNKRRM